MNAKLPHEFQRIAREILTEAGLDNPLDYLTHAYEHGYLENYSKACSLLLEQVRKYEALPKYETDQPLYGHQLMGRHRGFAPIVRKGLDPDTAYYEAEGLKEVERLDGNIRLARMRYSLIRRGCIKYQNPYDV